MLTWHALQDGRGSKLHRSTLSAMAALCTACVTTDHSGDPYAKEFVNHCFTTRAEAMFVSRECWKGAWKYCDTAVPIGPSGRDYPPTLQAYHDDPGDWSRRIHEAEMRSQPRLEADHVVIYGSLPIGTALTIVQVKDKFDGENGSYWMAFAVIEDGEFKGRRLLLPKAEASVANWQYLARCDNDKAAARLGSSGTNP